MSKMLRKSLRQPRSCQYGPTCCREWEPETKKQQRRRARAKEKRELIRETQKMLMSPYRMCRPMIIFPPKGMTNWPGDSQKLMNRWMLEYGSSSTGKQTPRETMRQMLELSVRLSPIAVHLSPTAVRLSPTAVPPSVPHCCPSF